MARVVVLGTGTGVGKTFVTVALARALKAADRNAWVAAVKPIETGIAKDVRKPPPGSDAAMLEAASRPVASPHPLYAFTDPVSAHLAAARERTRVSVAQIAKWARRIDGTALRDATSHHWLLLETAGGAFSPVTTRLTNVDLAAALDPAIWILVASDSLGVLHDIRATTVALASLRRAPDFLVLSGARESDASTGTNARELRRLGLPRPIAVLNHGQDGVAALAPLVRALRRRAAEMTNSARRGRSARVRA